MQVINKIIEIKDTCLMNLNKRKQRIVDDNDVRNMSGCEVAVDWRARPIFIYLDRPFHVVAPGPSLASSITTK